MTIKVKPLRMTISLLLALFSFFVFRAWLQRNYTAAGVSLAFWLQAAKADMLFLQADGELLRAKVFPGQGWQWVEFALPGRELRRMNLLIDKDAGIVVVGALQWRNFFHTVRLPAAWLHKQIDFSREQGLVSWGQGACFLQPSGSDAFSILLKDFPQQANRWNAERAFFRWLSLLLALLVFFLLCFLDFGNLLRLWPPRWLRAPTLLLLGLFCLPLVFRALHSDGSFSFREMRELAKPPALRSDLLADILPTYAQYFSDHFGGRSFLIRANSYLRCRFFGISPVPAVAIGQKGWLFMAREDGQRDEMAYCRHLRPFVEPELERWRRILEQRRRWLAARGVRFLFIVAPNKSTIYAHYLPPSIRPARPYSRLDQLLAYLRRDPDFPVLDLRPALLQATKLRDTYHRTDTHWNEYGAYVAYQEIVDYLRRFFPELRTKPLGGFRFAQMPRYGGDLAMLLSLQDSLYSENWLTLLPQKPRRAQAGPVTWLSPFVSRSDIVCPAADLPTAIMVHDSFTHELKPFLSEHFSRMVFIWDWGQNFYTDIVKREKPCVLLEEMAERYLEDILPENPSELLSAGVARR